MRPISHLLNSNYLPRFRTAVESNTAEPVTEKSESSPPGIDIQLSELGLRKTASSKRNQDIDDSDLPGQIRSLLQMIRELQQQLAEKTAELQVLMSSPGLDGDTRQALAQSLHIQIASLSGALSSAMANLVKALKDSGLSPEQLTQVAGLLMG